MSVVRSAQLWSLPSISARRPLFFILYMQQIIIAAALLAMPVSTKAQVYSVENVVVVDQSYISDPARLQNTLWWGDAQLAYDYAVAYRDSFDAGNGTCNTVNNTTSGILFELLGGGAVQTDCSGYDLSGADPFIADSDQTLLFAYGTFGFFGGRVASFQLFETGDIDFSPPLQTSKVFYATIPEIDAAGLSMAAFCLIAFWLALLGRYRSIEPKSRGRNNLSR